MRTSLIFLLLTALVLAGCGGFGATTVDMPTPIATFTPAPTLAPATATPVVQATATIATTAIPTSEATATPTTEPSATPTKTITPTALVPMATITPTLSATLTPTVSATVTPTVTPTVVATITPTVAATPTVRATATATPTPTAEPAASGGDDALYAGIPADVLALMPSADAANGQALTVSNGCTACHSLEKDVRVVGPSWYSVGATADTRVAGESAGLYLYTSIVDPNAFINEGFLAGLMPQAYKDIFSSQQLADLMAYLLTMQGK